MNNPHRQHQKRVGWVWYFLRSKERQGMEAHDSASLTRGRSRAARVVMPWAGLQSRERPVTPVGEQAEGSWASSWRRTGPWALNSHCKCRLPQGGVTSTGRPRPEGEGSNLSWPDQRP